VSRALHPAPAEKGRQEKREALMHIFGQPLKVLVAYSTAIIQCQCDAKPTLPLHGLNRPTICPACGKAFAIAESGKLVVGEVVTGGPDAPRVTR
jgi:hypothetical protein